MREINGSCNAYPIRPGDQYNDCSGMTVRERFALAAMQGMLADRVSYQALLSPADVAKGAVAYADALIKVLNT